MGPEEHGLEILFVYSGTGSVSNGSFSLDLKRGMAVLIPAASGSYSVSGSQDQLLEQSVFAQVVAQYNSVVSLQDYRIAFS